MSAGTGIERTDATWNPFVGCSIVSPGCTNCYAMQMAHRLTKMGSKKYQNSLTREVNGQAVWTGNVYFDEKSLTLPLKWRKPKRIFVNSMSDLFHENARDEDIDRVFAIMAMAPHHTFQLLTKRAQRMHDYFNAGPERHQRVLDAVMNTSYEAIVELTPDWPLPNVWLGVSVEDQQRANDRIPLLLRTPAAKRFISAEPQLNAVNLENWFPPPSPDRAACRGSMARPGSIRSSSAARAAEDRARQTSDTSDRSCGRGGPAGPPFLLSNSARMSLMAARAYI